MVRIQDFHSWHTSSILVESTIKDNPVTTGNNINKLNSRIMAKNVKTAATKSRETKLGKKTSEELIEIILRKDKTERNLNAQVLNLKSEVNTLTSRINNFDKDMEGTYQSLETYKDKCKTLQENIDSIKIESKDNYDKYFEENKKVITLTNKCNIWKVATYIMTAIATIAVLVAVL